MNMAEEKSGALTGLVLVAAMLAGLAYWVTSLTTELSGTLVALKGSGVGLLAVWAALNAREADGWLIAAVMVFGATGDVLIECAGLVPAAVAFLVGHLIAIALYLRNRRETLVFSQKLLAIILVPVVVGVAWLLPTDRSEAPGIALYSLGLASMAAMAWTSRFSRYWVGIGAMLFVVSDLLIFARIGPLAGSAIPDLLVWPLYFTGQAMIVMGVVRTLEADRAAQ